MTLTAKYPAKRLDPVCVEIPRSARADMLVPARIWVDEELWKRAVSDRTLDQLVNVPGSTTVVVSTATRRQERCSGVVNLDAQLLGTGLTTMTALRDWSVAMFVDDNVVAPPPALMPFGSARRCRCR